VSDRRRLEFELVEAIPPTVNSGKLPCLNYVAAGVARTMSLMTRQAVPTKSSPDPSIRRSRAVSASVATRGARTQLLRLALTFLY
jgi:hypothetical protein